jgi:site-specific recombinase XerD
MSDGLEPTTPAEAVEWYLAERDPDLSEKSLQNQRYRLRRFLEFCDEHDIDEMNTLTGRDIHRYRVWRNEDVKPVTLQGELQTFRVFLEFCAAIDAVEPGMRERVQIPDIEPEDEARDEHLSPERAREIIEHWEQFAYASRDHVIMAILWHTGIRLGSLRAFDLEDFDADAQCLDLRHRPETGTPLKNKSAAERSIAVGPHYCDVLQDYITHNRESATDDHGRRPLFSSSRGRLSEGAIRETIYRMTQPCQIGQCPHDIDPSTCEFKQHGQRAGCPSSRSPHGIRRGSITHHLRSGTPQEVVTDRSNVSKEIIEQHYDERTDREKMEVRRDLLEGV